MLHRILDGLQFSYNIAKQSVLSVFPSIYVIENERVASTGSSLYLVASITISSIQLQTKNTSRSVRVRWRAGAACGHPEGDVRTRRGPSTARRGDTRGASRVQR